MAYPFVPLLWSAVLLVAWTASEVPVLIRLEGGRLAVGDFTRPDFDHTDFMTAGMGDAFGCNDHGDSAITQHKFRKTMLRHQWSDDGVRAFHTVLFNHARGDTVCKLRTHGIKIGEADDNRMTVYKCS